ncbi:MAG: hypothetical protein H3C26_20195 [Rhodocyclaceae bacterium]|nr:hypothetical protein [Rhodocyclaceae bacterium]
MTHAVREDRPAYRLEQDDWPQFWPDQSPLSGWHYYTFEHIDRFEFMRPARPELPHEGAEGILQQIAEKFRAQGWEGDGDIEVFWMPPFIASRNDTAGFIVFHVRQQNNGVSFLASPYPLPGLKE